VGFNEMQRLVELETWWCVRVELRVCIWGVVAIILCYNTSNRLSNMFGLVHYRHHRHLINM